jgi:hypothetical protein
MRSANEALKNDGCARANFGEMPTWGFFCVAENGFDQDIVPDAPNVTSEDPTEGDVVFVTAEATMRRLLEGELTFSRALSEVDASEGNRGCLLHFLGEVLMPLSAHNQIPTEAVTGTLARLLDVCSQAIVSNPSHCRRRAQSAPASAMADYAKSLIMESSRADCRQGPANKGLAAGGSAGNST